MFLSIFANYSDLFCGTFALYSIVCRYAKVGLLPNNQVEDTQVSNYQLGLLNRRHMRAFNLKTVLQRSHFMKIFLLSTTLLGTSMVIGDGVLTPCISVLSCVGGIKEPASSITEMIILIGLFMVQRFGTDKVVLMDMMLAEAMLMLSLQLAYGCVKALDLD
ncbi:potassium transporter 5-like [Vicia villosa]|uniref:potassium transporter 5-like n=1 Tax=Vicia villosa TaxID=3911 RepID=UPI00273C056C|nr:potassium transporter 5-like [Vicia villosa]